MNLKVVIVSIWLLPLSFVGVERVMGGGTLSRDVCELNPNS